MPNTPSLSPLHSPKISLKSPLPDSQVEVEELTERLEETGLEDEISPPSSVTHSITSSTNFQARPLPVSHTTPSITPRLSKAALLRMGITPPAPPSRTPSNATTSTTSLSTETRNVPLPRSLTAPTVGPRPTRASVLRAGNGEVRPNLGPRQASTTSQRSSTASFENTPGHRRQSLQIQVNSVAPPSIAPRQTKASALRAGELTESTNKGPRMSMSTAERAMRATNDNALGYRRHSLQISVSSIAPPTVAPRQTKASALRAGDLTQNENRGPRQALGTSERGFRDDNTPGYKRRPTGVVIPSTREPTVKPRMTKAATLRTGTPMIREDTEESIEGERDSKPIVVDVPVPKRPTPLTVTSKPP